MHLVERLIVYKQEFNGNEWDENDLSGAQIDTSLRERLDDMAEKRADIPVRANPKLFHSNDNLHRLKINYSQNNMFVMCFYRGDLNPGIENVIEQRVT